MQQNRALTYLHEQQFFGYYVLIVIRHYNLLSGVRFCVGQTILAPIFDFCRENCVRLTGQVVAVKICGRRQWSRIVVMQHQKHLRCFGELHFEQTAIV